MVRWLLSGLGGLKNVAALLSESFGPTGTVAATIDTGDGTISAYPTDPTAAPAAGAWTRSPNGWTHPFDTDRMPHSISAQHHVVAGVTSRNELLIVNLAAVGYLGIESADPVPIMRSWLMQTLTKTPEAHVAVTEPALAIPGAPRITALADPAEKSTATVLFTTEHTSTPDPGASTIVVSSRAAGADNALMCDGAVSGIYLANRYWPIWRRMELPNPQWDTITAALAPTLAPKLTPAEEAAPAQQVTVTPDLPSVTTDEPATTVEPASSVAEADPPFEPTTRPMFLEPLSLDTNSSAAQHEPAAETAAVAALFGHDLPPATTAAEPAQVGIYVLGETFVIGVDPDSGEHVKESAVIRNGGKARRPVTALMVLATHSRLTTNDWADVLNVKSANRRQLHTQIRKLIGRDRIDIDGSGALALDLFCDWKEFQRLIGHDPTAATTENLIAAMGYVRGKPFADIPEGEYTWRSVELLKDQLLDQCSDAALELARRHAGAGAISAAHDAAMLGLAVYPQREDLWTVAMETVNDDSRRELAYDLRKAIPAPATPGLRKLLATVRTH